MSSLDCFKNSKQVISVGLIAIALFTIACIGPTAIAQPTRKLVKPSDIAGNYYFRSMHSGREVTVTVELSANGYFTITGLTNSAGFGTWVILKNNDLSLSYTSKPAGVIGWYVTDDYTGGYDIMGGEGDPDNWEPLHRVGQ